MLEYPEKNRLNHKCNSLLEQLCFTLLQTSEEERLHYLKKTELEEGEEDEVCLFLRQQEL